MKPAAMLLALAAPAVAEFPQPPDKPNIIVVLMDDWGYNDIGAYSYPSTTDYYPGSGPEPYFSQTDPDIPAPNQARTLTPAIDSMATEGIRFTSYYACATVCTPSRAGLLSGCYAPRVSMPNVINPLSNSGLNTTEVILPEILKTRGYATGMVGKWHLGYNPDQLRRAQFLPTRHGFDEYLGIPYSNDMFQRENFLIDNETPVLSMGTDWASAGTNQHTIIWRYTERALDFIERSQGGPFFLYLCHSMPHVPTWPSQSTFANADGTTWPRFAGASGVSWYYDIVMEIDHSMSRILDKLKALGIDDKTMVVFTSDNGPWLAKGGVDKDDTSVGCAYPLRESKSYTYEGGPRVPFIARWPGMIPAGRVSDEVGGHIDLLPTLAGLAGASPPTDRVIDGRDLWPVLSGQPGAASPHSELYYYQGTTLHAVRRGPWKFRRPNSTTRELFDLDHDIQERSNELAAEPVLASDLEATLDAFDAGLQTNKRSSGTFSDQEIVVDRTRLTLPEGDSASFRVKLIQDPGGPFEVRVAPVYGDDCISVSGGAALSFDSGNWNAWQTVSVKAAEDPDTLDGGAIVRCSSPAIQPVCEVFALAIDNDSTPRVEASLVWPRIPDPGIADAGVRLHAEGRGVINTIGNPKGMTFSWTQPDGPATVSFTAPESPATGISFPVDGLYSIALAVSFPGAGSDTVGFDIRVGATPFATPPATFANSADADTDGGPIWEEVGGNPERNWSLAANVTRSATDPAPGLPGLDAAYQFSGTAIAAGGRSFHYDAFSTGNASIALWIRPDDIQATGGQVIWETGGDIGASFTRNASTLLFAVDDGSGNAATGAVLSTPMFAAADHDGFIHLVGVIDLAADIARLYLNGSEVATATIQAVNDWCGNSYTGLATIADSAGNESTTDGHLGGNDLLGGGPWATFGGLVASYRFYDRALSPAEINSLFVAASVAGIGPQVDAGPDQAIAFTAAASLSGTATDDGRPGPAPATEWSRAAGPGAATIADPAAPATTAGFSLPGVYQMRLFADDTQVRVYDDTSVTVAPLSYAEWATTISFAAGEDDPGGNPDGDQWVNLWEWALGLDPLAADPGAGGLQFRTEPLAAGTRLVLEFDKPRDRQPAIVFQQSTDLVDWDPLATPPPLITPISDTHEHWVFAYDAPATETRLFLRAEVTE